MKISRLLIASIVLLTIANHVAFADSVPPIKPNISLTLIPPSPVTDQIILDVRAGIWNNTDVKKTVYVSFYLDVEKKSNLLHKQTISITANANAGIKFPWSTKGMAGNHKIILVSRSGKEVLRKERPMQILSSTIRSTKKIDGAARRSTFGREAFCD